MMPFVKMHGCGNDFVVLRAADLDALALDTAGLAAFVQRVCDRHYGIGADGLLAYTVHGEHRLRMVYWNRDGSRAEMCGNGARCVVRLAWERGEVRTPLVLDTDAGSHVASVLPRPPRPPWVEIDMGAVRWDGASIGLRDPVAEWVDAPVEIGTQRWRVTALAVGNPHAVVFLPDRAALEAVDLGVTGRALAEHALFGRGANASFVIVQAGELWLRVYERGVGPTLACGSASCAALAAAVRLGALATPAATVHLPGGDVEVRQDAEQHVWLRGPATPVASGELDLEAYGG